MRVLHVRKKTMKTTTIGAVVVGCVGLGLLIGGGATGNPILAGAGVALLLFSCVGVLGTRRVSTPSVSHI